MLGLRPLRQTVLRSLIEDTHGVRLDLVSLDLNRLTVTEDNAPCFTEVGVYRLEEFARF